MDKTNPAPGKSGDGAGIGKADSAYLSPSIENINTPSGADAAPPPDRDSGAVKGPRRRVSRAPDVSQVRWTINERFGLGRDSFQFIVYRAITPKSGKPRRKLHEHKPVAYFTSLEVALMWVIMRQAHFEDDPTIDSDILDAFQRYVHVIDQTKADIHALAERLEAGMAT